MKTIAKIWSVLLVVFFLSYCKEEQEDLRGNNPYPDWSYDYPRDNDSFSDADANSLAGIYKNIFQPTCANSGCHDGNFEPDFRTLQSTYHSLINKRVIKPDSAGLIPYRVVPGNADESMLIIRMVEDLNGNSGIMPLSLEPDSDWPTKKQEHIESVRQWINNGAKDLFGNDPTPIDIPPRLKGFAVTRNGENVPFSRIGNRFSTVRIPTGVSSIDVWFCIVDDNSSASQLIGNTVRKAINLSKIDEKEELQLSVLQNGPSFIGLNNELNQYTHKITFNLNDLGDPGEVVWFKAFIGDGVNPISGLPASSSLFQLKTYCSIKLP